jgi:MFS transporter, ACS family, glucarate transporter
MSHRRTPVIAFAASLAALTYIDRVCISQAETTISGEFELTRKQMGYVFAAFVWGYALLDVPLGWLGDRFGPRKVLTGIVIWWSFFTAATGWAWSLGSLIVIRFLFGSGEAGGFPNLTKALKTWLPPREQVRAQSIVWLSARWGGAFTPLLVVFLLEFMSWRIMFVVLGSIGIGWAILFHRLYRDQPEDPGSVAGIERGPIPWKRMLTSPAVILLCLQYMFLTYAWYFYVTWLPRYLEESRRVAKGQAALLAALPLFLGGLGCLASGALSAPAVRLTGSVRTARRLLAGVGFGGAALLLPLSLRFEDPWAAMLVVGLAGLFNDFAMPVSWAACMDLGGRHTGTLSGIMNMCSAVAGSCAAVVTAALLERIGGDWAPIFYIASVLYILGLCAWLFLDPVTPLVPETESRPEEVLS